MKISKFLFSASISLVALLSIFCSPSLAQVIINGHRLTHYEIQWLSNTLKTPIPSGNYWVNWSTGQWGYAGSWQVMGNVYSNLQQSYGGNGGYNGDNYYYRSPDGSLYVNDGYFYDSGTGCSVGPGGVSC